MDEFPINFTRGYHVTYVSNGVTKVKESSDTASSAYQQRVKSPSYDKGVIPVGSSVICKGLATARVWFVTYENTLIGYTEFVKEYTIPETYNGSSYDRIYIDAKNNDSSVMETNYAKKNIRVVGELQRVNFYKGLKQMVMLENTNLFFYKLEQMIVSQKQSRLIFLKRTYLI